MSLARNLLLRASRSRWLAEHVVRQPFAQRASKRFLPGEHLADALAAAKVLSGKGIGVIITKLGEALTQESDAVAVRDHYLGAIDAIVRENLPVVISIKPTQLAIDHSTTTCMKHLRALAASTQAAKSQLWIDMEGSAYTDRTIDLYCELKAEFSSVGIAIQAYLRRTPADIDRLMSVKPMIRLVKGAYAEPAEIAFPAKKDTDAQFIAVSERMLDGALRGEVLPVFGTHDGTIVEHLTRYANRLGLKNDQYEVHTLYGIAMADQERRAAEGSTVRCMINYGSQWFPWYMRRLAERPANVGFVLKSLLNG